MMASSMQLIDRDGNFNVIGAHQFFKEFKSKETGVSFVSIIGAQCSGKSTLLNHLFGTNFRELNASKGRFGTTEGIWAARCVDIEPCTIVMDIEGTDGKERGEDTTFEKQSALFAFAVSDIVLINMWSHDIGREEAANKLLLGIVFEFMMQLFNPRKTTLMFVLRDKSQAPLKNSESVLRQFIQKIWDSIPKTQAQRETLLSDFFNVEIVALSSYENKKEQFKVEVASLRQRFVHSIVPSRHASDGSRVVSANAFVFSAEEKWQMIKNLVSANAFAFSTKQEWQMIKNFENLYLTTHEVASLSCEDIVNHKVLRFMKNEDWLKLTEDVWPAPIIGVGKRLNSILQSFLSEFDTETTSFDKDVRFSNRQQLQIKLLRVIQPIFQIAIKHLRLRAFQNFKDTLEKALNSNEGLASSVHSYVQSCMSQFDKDCEEFVIKEANWDISKTWEMLHRDIRVYIDSVRVANLSKLTVVYESKLKEALDGPVESLLDIANDATWPSIRKLVIRETKLAFNGLSNALSGFDIDEKTQNKMFFGFEKYAHDLVEAKVRKESAKVLRHMENRFATIFNYDSDSFPRCWTKMEDIKTITKMAHIASLKVLSVLTVIRLDDKDDNVEKILSDALINSTNVVSLASNTWEKVVPTRTLITPRKCRSIWYQFKNETEYLVTNAISIQEAKERDNNLSFRPWVKKLFLK